MATITLPPELPRIDVHSLVKRYHRHPVLNQLSLTINSGDFCLLVGDNGAGKTTLLRILAGLVRPSQGAATLCGADALSNPLVRREIGYVGHQPMVYQDLSAYENLLHSARLYQLENSEERISQALQALGLAAQQHQPVRALSRGLLQRLSLARATLHQPSILLFDEPYTSLDQEAAGFLDRSLQNWHRPERIILLAAHRPQRLLSLASHVAWLKDGRIDAHIPVSALAGSPELNNYLREVT